MAFDNTNFHGTALKFGFQDTDAPAALSAAGFYAHTAETTYTPEVNAYAMGGEGQIIAQAITKPDKRKIDLKLTGYVDLTTWDAAVIDEGFNFLSPTRFFTITNISEPRKKGEYWEVSIDAGSVAGITG